MHNTNSYIPVIGLEIHIELKTKSKMFCQCSANYFTQEPNTHVCPVCLGLPGALPVPNRKAVEWTVLIGRALNCRIRPVSKFDRKHYFYPDLPKGYQISQYDEPLAVDGALKIPSFVSANKASDFGSTESSLRPTQSAGKPNFAKASMGKQNTEYGIQRVHLEEDTGKLIHRGEDTLIDFNRSGVPLVEIVTEPCFESSDEVKFFLEELQTIIRYLDVSDADMEKGSMRLEPNISLKLKVPSFVPLSGTTAGKQKSEGKTGELPNYKVEVKNINSFRFVKQAIDYEIKRQTGILEKGETPKQETRGFSEDRQATYSQRSKEQAHDYRYFPEPDIPPMMFTEEDIKEIVKKMPELPFQKIERYIKQLRLRFNEAFIITRNKKTAEYFDEVVALVKIQKKDGIDIQKLANLIVHKRIGTHTPPREFVSKATELLAPKKTDADLLSKIIIQVLAKNPKPVEDYRKGKHNAIMFLVGQVMREMKGKADAKKVIEEIKKKLTRY